MGGGAQELTGPDLEKGIAFADLVEQKPLLGHAHGEAIVVVRVGEDVHAIGASCTHYGGPLAEGLVVGTTIRCPWHHACFDLKSGEAASAPALMDVACWQVAREGDLVQVRAKKAAAAAKKATHAPSSIVIIGAGAAGAACAEMLRKEGYAGPIAMLGAEEPGPVDRPNLSKDYLAGTAPEEWIPLGGLDRWREIKVDLSPNDPATAIDTKQKTVTTASGKTLSYGALLYATGAEPSRLPIEGASLPHVFTLRSLGDSRAIIERAKTAKRAVVIGASFIGLEVAASLIARGLEVHVVGPENVPLAPVLGEEVGAFLKGVHEAKGTHFHLGKKPASISATAVTLESGETIECDLVVLGVGVKPRISLATQAGLQLGAGGVVVDEALNTNAPSVWAAGDAARYRGSIRIEHWVVAERAGQHVAREMLRDPSTAPHKFRDVPFFWSVHHDVTLAYVGFVPKLEGAQVYGSLEKRDATIGIKGAGGKTLAVATINRDAVSLAVEAALEKGDVDEVERIIAR
jgi:NADPH-dependent 2,4-dienoyl-CoA reductase/sulfur reductase-like enzyme/nitrite reductase/ring-hydroxylating ferredoxin subunit